MSKKNVELIIQPSVLFVAGDAFGMGTVRNIFRNKRHFRKYVVMRHVVVYFMYKEGISHDGISALTGIDRTTIYAIIYRLNDLLSVGDKIATEAVNKINYAKANYTHTYDNSN